MKLCISKIHLGRYRIEQLDNNNQVINGTDGGSALIMMWLTDWIFKQEHTQYLIDQRRSSDELGAEAIARAHSGLDETQRKLLADIEAKREAAKANRAVKLIEEINKHKTNR